MQNFDEIDFNLPFKYVDIKDPNLHQIEIIDFVLIGFKHIRLTTFALILYFLSKLIVFLLFLTTTKKKPPPPAPISFPPRQLHFFIKKSYNELIL